VCRNPGPFVLGRVETEYHTPDAWMGGFITDSSSNVWAVDRAEVRHGRLKLDLTRSLLEERTRRDYRRNV
jgi:hypothetical protein